MKGVVSQELFFFEVFDSLNFSDVLPALIKSYFFGFAIGMIGCFKGYNSKKGTEGVGLAANSAVVVASLMIFLLDLIAVQIADVLGLT
jgi:phospholipid/cholesterol/gamma-HCH transport system permease protein